MPWSAAEGKDVAKQLLGELRPVEILDVGVGAGTYGRMVRETLDDVTLDGVEIWEPYVERFGLHAIYDSVFIEDVRHFKPTKIYDLVIMGDVIEHMSQSDALKTIQRLRAHAGYILVSLPIVEFHQGEAEGNPHEAHLHHWSHDQCLEHFEPVRAWHGDVLGVYLIEGDR